MNKLKFGDFIKVALVILTAVFMFSGQTIAFARAGGGGASSSHSSSSHSSSYHRSSSSNGTSEHPTLIETIIIIVIIIAVIIIAKIVIRNIRLAKMKNKNISTMESLSKLDSKWNYDNINRDIKDAFYMIQISWKERNEDFAREYMSDYMYCKHKLQIEDMKIRKEKNILENMILLEAKPIGLQDFAGINKDYIWVQIKAKAKDYMVNEETNEVIKGKISRDVHFEEYWKFIRNEKRWVLDSIKQVDQITNLGYFD
jgi:Uncharacterized protein conserved in bacteria